MRQEAVDVRFMRRALRLARRAAARVHPNPYVGAVLVKGGSVVGQGWHAKFGGPHAEAVAIRRAGASAKGATLYVTLEPCAHQGKTPPCDDLILRSGVRRVVFGASDPNPLVSGKGVRRLQKAGVRVVAGILKRECEALNRDWNHWMKTGLPWVALKVAESLDGRIATARGESKWITGPEARRSGHALRAASDAVMVGVNTVLVDDPRLDARGVKAVRQPIRVIMDTTLRTPPNARLFTVSGRSPVVLVCSRSAPAARAKRLERRAAILRVRKRGGRVDLKETLRELASRGVVRVLLEGGAELAASAVELGLAQEAYIFIAPIILGGRAAKPAVGGLGAATPREAWELKDVTVTRLGRDVLVHGRF